MFDYTNEDMGESVFDKSQINFRKKEKLMKLSFQLILLVICIGYIIDMLHAIVTELKIYYYIHSVYWAVELLLLIILYCYLRYLMSNLHNYEY
jgi:hypothetical protein